VTNEWFMRHNGGRPTSVDEMLDLIDMRPSWHERAACADERAETLAMTLGYLNANDLMVPLGQKGRPKGTDVIAAKTICRRCDVRETCLAYALKHHESGIWGGTTDRDRQRMRKAST